MALCRLAAWPSTVRHLSCLLNPITVQDRSDSCGISTLTTSSNFSSSSSDSQHGDFDQAFNSTAEQLLQHQPNLGFFAPGAAILDTIHSFTGMPWWVVIPATAVTIKTLLLPLSLKQARIIRTNMVLWTESFELQRQRHARAKHHQQHSAATAQQHTSAASAAAAASHTTAWQPTSATIHVAGRQQQSCHQQPQHQHQLHQQQLHETASISGGATAPAASYAGDGSIQQQAAQVPGADSPATQLQISKATAAVQQLQRWQERIQLYHDLRWKCQVPHPMWFAVNQVLQVPIFIYTAASIRRMAQAGWLGFGSEGLLWFSDLTKPAMVLVESGVHLPMGVQGLVLPLAVTGMMLTSIRLGFKASGAASRHPSLAGTWLSPFLAYLPPLLYSLTIASTYIKLQLPQAVLLHWMASSSYTLGLQLGLKHPRVRSLLGYSQQLPGAGEGGAGGVDPAVAAQAIAVDNADVLVVMGAKHAALQRYSEALFCLHRALLLDPGNARAHYSTGQIHALQHQWPQSEDRYRTCAELLTDEQPRGQALYCVGVACHQQGKFQEALQAYEQASKVETIQPMVVLGQVRALKELGQPAEAKAVASAFMQSEQASRCSAAVLDALRCITQGPKA